MANTAVDCMSLSGEQAAGRALEWGANVQGWIVAHDTAIGFIGSPDELFVLSNGQTKSIAQLGCELKNVGYTGPWDRNAILSAYGRTAGVSLNHYTPPSGTSVRGGDQYAGGIVSTDPNQANTTAHTLAGASSGIVGALQQSVGFGGVNFPLYVWLGGGILAYEFLGKRRRR